VVGNIILIKERERSSYFNPNNSCLFSEIIKEFNSPSQIEDYNYKYFPDEEEEGKGSLR